MSNSINLLHTNRPSHSPIVSKRIKFIRTISLGFLFIVGTVSAILFILTTFSPLEKLQEEERAILVEFSSGEIQKKADSYFLTKVRSEDISKLLSTRSQLLNLYGEVVVLAEGSISLSNIAVTKEATVMSAESPSLTEIQGMLDGIVKITKKYPAITSSTLSDIKYDPISGKYSFSVSLDFKKA